MRIVIKGGCTFLEGFDVQRAKLSDKDLFPRFRVQGGIPLKQALREKRIRKQDEVLVLERGEERLAFSMHQMAYHHVAQGKLAGEPYLVVF